MEDDGITLTTDTSYDNDSDNDISFVSVHDIDFSTSLPGVSKLYYIDTDYLRPKKLCLDCFTSNTKQLIIHYSVVQIPFY